ncbi:MAG TPA: hypothetical protein VLH60_05330 [Sedimentisphaerales bacterium]|nr:hypothetical protein [Sedimentisphaerales bacterium]
MQVNRTENTDIRPFRDAVDKPLKAVASAEGKDSLSVDTAGYVAKARALPTDGAASAAAIEAAKALVASGEIDSLETIMETAKNIVERGI